MNVPDNVDEDQEDYQRLRAKYAELLSLKQCLECNPMINQPQIDRMEAQLLCLEEALYEVGRRQFLEECGSMKGYDLH